MRKIKVLMVTECSYLSTGYAVYARNLLTQLHSDSRFEIAEMGTFFNPHDNKVDQIPWTFFANVPPNHLPENKKNELLQDVRFQMGYYTFNDIVLEYQPDIVISAMDYWMQSFINASPYRKCFSSIWMCPHDSIPQEKQWLEDMSNHDGIITYCDWATEEIKKASPKINVLGAATPCAEPEFFPINKTDVRQSFGIDPNIKIVGTTMRNQFRKLYPNLLESFKTYLDESKREDVYLLIHSSYPDGTWSFPDLIQQYEVAHKTLFSFICHNCNNTSISFYTDFGTCKRCGQIACKMPSTEKGVSIQDLNRIYNLFDIYVQYSNSEGCGMPAIESASCNVPVAEVDYSAMGDIVRKLGGYPIRVLGFNTEINTGCKRALPENQHLVEILIKFFNKPQAIRNLEGLKTGKNVDRYYRWENTGKVWANALVSVFKDGEGWKSPITHHQIPPFDEMSHVKNSDYAKWLIVNVAGRPNKVGSLMEAQLVRDLNYLRTTNSHKAETFAEDSKLANENKLSEFNRRIAYDDFVRMGEELIHYEAVRAQRMGL